MNRIILFLTLLLILILVTSCGSRSGSGDRSSQQPEASSVAEEPFVEETEVVIQPAFVPPPVIPAPVIPPQPVVTPPPAIAPQQPAPPPIVVAPVVETTPVVAAAPVITPPPVVEAPPVVAPPPVVEAPPAIAATPVVAPLPMVSPPIVEAPPQVPEAVAEVFDPSNVPEALYESTIIEVRIFIDSLNRIIQNRNFEAWRASLSDDFFAYISSPEHLRRISEMNAMRVRGITLRSAEDFFQHVVVPSRANSRVDEIEFIDENRVKAFTVTTNRAGQTQRLRLYDLEFANNSWTIIN